MKRSIIEYKTLILNDPLLIKYKDTIHLSQFYKVYKPYQPISLNITNKQVMKLNYIHLYHIYPSLLSIIQKINHAYYHVIDNEIGFYKININNTMTLYEYLDEQHQYFHLLKDKMIVDWYDLSISLIRDSIIDDNLDYNNIQQRYYQDKNPLYRCITYITYLLRQQLASFSIQSLKNLMFYFKKNYQLLSSNPDYEKQKKKKKKKNKFDELQMYLNGDRAGLGPNKLSNPALFICNLSISSSTTDKITFLPQLDVIKSKLLDLLDIYSMLKPFTSIDTKVLPILKSKTANISLELLCTNQNTPHLYHYYQQAKKQLINLITINFKQPKLLAILYQNLLTKINKAKENNIKQHFYDNLDQTVQQIKDYNVLINEIYSISPDEIYFGLLQIKCNVIKDILIEKVNKYKEELLTGLTIDLAQKISDIYQLYVNKKNRLLKKVKMYMN